MEYSSACFRVDKQNRDGAALVTSRNACCMQVGYVSKSSTVKQYFLAIISPFRYAVRCGLVVEKCCFFVCKEVKKVMDTFICTKFRLCKYLMDRGFLPYASKPDKFNPKYRVYLFEENEELNKAVSQYIHVDSWTARQRNNKGVFKNERQKEESL